MRRNWSALFSRLRDRIIIFKRVLIALYFRRQQQKWKKNLIKEIKLKNDNNT